MWQVEIPPGDYRRSAMLDSVVFIVTMSSSTGNIGNHSQPTCPRVPFVLHSSNFVSDTLSSEVVFQKCCCCSDCCPCWDVFFP